MSRKRRSNLRPMELIGLLREIRKAGTDTRPIVVGGAPSLAAALERDLSAGGDRSAVRSGSPAGAAAMVYVLAGEAGAPEVRDLRAASRAGVPIVCITSGAADGPIPYVLATDVIVVPPGEGFPLEEIGRTLANRLGLAAAPLAGRLPVLREAVCGRLIESYARKNGVVGAAVFIPGADMPLMTLNQMRLVMRIAAAHGMDPEPERVVEMLGVLGTGFGLRVVGRSLLGFVPVAGWAVRAGMGYAGTVAVGQAAMRYYAAQAEAL